MLASKQITFECLAGIIYDFPEVGDELPKHWHREGKSHISIVARGSFRAFGNNWEKTVKSGDVIDWPAMRPHGFVALEPDSRLVNISKGSQQAVNEFSEIVEATP